MRPHDLGDLFPVLEEDERGHGADAQFLGDVGHLVDVEFVETGGGVGIGELDDFGGDGFAGGAPGGHAVDDHEGGVGEGGVVVGFAVKVLVRRCLLLGERGKEGKWERRE